MVTELPSFRNNNMNLFRPSRVRFFHAYSEDLDRFRIVLTSMIENDWQVPPSSIFMNRLKS
ncbi:hypothetical protein ABD76_26210 [Paenibacillus dendritiformis]|nr:hypothetical protein [Paenibacillus dendritiformis]